MRFPLLAAAALLAGAFTGFLAPGFAQDTPASAPSQPATSEAAATTAASRPVVSPAQVWDMLFGREAAALATKTDRRESAAFAAKIVAAAKQIPDDPAAQAFLLLKAYDYGIITPDGYAAANTAMETLRELPGQTLLADEKMLSLFELMWKNTFGANRRALAAAYAAKAEDLAAARLDAWKPDEGLLILRKAASAAEMTGGDVNIVFQARLKEAVHKSTVQRRAAELKTAAESGLARTKAAVELTELILLEKNRPAEAAAVVAMTGDETLVKTVADAQKKPAELTDDQLLELAAWYDTKLAAATDYAKYQTAPHALELLEHFLIAHEREDVLRLKAKLLRENISKMHTKAAAVVLREYNSNILALIDPAKHAVDGIWKIENGKLTATNTLHQIRLRVPFRPAPEYDLHCSFKRVAGEDGLVLVIPTGKSVATLIVAGWGNTACAIENASTRKKLRGNPTTYRPPGGVIKTGTPHTLVVKVRNEGIAVILDGKEIITYKADAGDLSPTRPDWQLQCPIVIATFMKQLEITKLEVIPVSGRGEKVELAPLPAPGK